MKPSGYLWLVAVAMFAVGLLLGFAPVHRDSYDCGSAFSPNNGLAVSTQQAQQTLAGVGVAVAPVDCPDAVSSRRVEAWVPLVLGVVAVVGAMVAASRETQARVAAARARVVDADAD